MQTIKHEKKLGKEKLERIIEMCIAIENHTVEPFTLNVDEIIKIVQEYFPNWENPEELKLDAEALHHLASVIKMQSEWVKQRSTSLYTDPFLLEEKIRQTSKQGMVDVFLGAWNPLVEFEQLSLHSLRRGCCIGRRWLLWVTDGKTLMFLEVAMGYSQPRELVKQRVLGDREFSEELECYWQELKDKVAEKGVDGKIAYWDFIGAETYEETVQRAFLTSFLVTYGYATLEIDRLEETIFILPFDKPTKRSLNRAVHVGSNRGIMLKTWQKWKRGEQV